MSNGCLMRITPQAVWGYKLGKEDLYNAVMLQTGLTHLHKTAVDTSYLYCYAIGILINTGDSDLAFKMTKEEAKNRNGLPEDPVSEWFHEIEKGNLPSCSDKNIGYLKIAFFWTFHYLFTKTPFEVALADIVSQGGDTDTNAAIACGVLGAAQGLTSIHRFQVEKMISARTDLKEWKGRRRGEFLVPALYLPQTLNLIYLNAPKTL